MFKLDPMLQLLNYEKNDSNLYMMTFKAQLKITEQVQAIIYIHVGIKLKISSVIASYIITCNFIFVLSTCCYSLSHEII